MVEIEKISSPERCVLALPEVRAGAQPLATPRQAIDIVRRSVLPSTLLEGENHDWVMGLLCGVTGVTYFCRI